MEPISPEETKMERMMKKVANQDDVQLIGMDRQVQAYLKVIIEEDALDHLN